MTTGILEILLVFFVVFLIFDPRRLANVGRALGRGVRDFKLEFGSKKESAGPPGKEGHEKLARKR